MSHPYSQPQPELAYPLSRTRRRWLVALMEIGALWTVVGIRQLHSYSGIGLSYVVIAGLVVSAVCYFKLFSTVRHIAKRFFCSWSF
jgi:hypothetical protein